MIIPSIRHKILVIDCGKVFIPLITMGTVVYFDSRVPTDWEIKHLPKIYLSGDEWDPTDDGVFLGHKCREHVEMQTIKSLTSGMMK